MLDLNNVIRSSRFECGFLRGVKTRRRSRPVGGVRDIMDDGKTRVEAWAAAPESKSDRTTGTTCGPREAPTFTRRAHRLRAVCFLKPLSQRCGPPGSDRIGQIFFG